MFRSMTAKIFLGLAVGIGLGLWAHSAGSPPEVLAWFNVPSKFFLNLIKCIVAPLIVTMLVVGIAGHEDLRQLGRLGVRTMGYLIVVTMLALVVGLIAVNLLKPGEGVALPAETRPQA